MNTKIIIESKRKHEIIDTVKDYLDAQKTWSKSDFLHEEHYLELCPSVKKKTYDQIKCFKGMTTLVYEIEMLAYKTSYLEGVRNHYKEQIGFIDGYEYDMFYQDEYGIVRSVSHKAQFEEDIPHKAGNIKVSVKSCADASRDIMSQLISLVLFDLDKALEHDLFTTYQQDRYLKIREEMEQKSLNKLREREEKKKLS